MESRSGTQCRHLVFSSTYTSSELLEKFPDEPEVTERVNDGALEHGGNGARAGRGVLVSFDGAVVGGTSGHRSAVDGDGIVHEEFNPYGGEACRRWTTRAVLRGLCGQEELGAIDGKSGHSVVEVPVDDGAECGFVEFNGGFGVSDGEHRRDLGWHCG